MKYPDGLPDDMMEYLRQRRRLEKDDTSQDTEILVMPPDEIVSEISCWLLGSDWSGEFRRLFENVGIILED